MPQRISALKKAPIAGLAKASHLPANYDPYGLLIEQGGLLGSAFGFTGEQTDANNLIYLRARYYNPALGMFQSKDPEMGYMGLAMSMNGYSYVHGNPVNLTDPSGRLVFLPLLAAMAVGAGIGGAVSFGTEYIGQIHHNMAVCGMDFLTAAYHENLDWGRIGKSTLQGAVLGGLSGLAGFGVGALGMKGVMGWAAGEATDFVAGVAWDALVNGDDIGTAVLNNLIGFGMGGVIGVIGHGFGRVWRTARGLLSSGPSPKLRAGETLNVHTRGQNGSVPTESDIKQAGEIVDRWRLQAQKEGWVDATMSLKEGPDVGQQGEIVRRFDSKQNIKNARKNGIEYDPNEGAGIPTTTTNLDPVNSDKIKRLLGARQADAYIDIDISGKPVLRRRTKSGWIEIVVQSDIIPNDIIDWGSVRRK